MSKTIHIVFDGPPGPTAGRFVEVEDANGFSFDAGEWRERDDGLWELVIHAAIDPSKVAHIHQAGTIVGKHIDTCAKCGKDIWDPIHIRDFPHYKKPRLGL